LSSKGNDGLEMNPRSQGPRLDYWRPSFPDMGRFAEAVGDLTVPQGRQSGRMKGSI
jgi:hypothetical protein